MIQQAVKHGTGDGFEDIRDKVFGGKALLWIGWTDRVEAVAVTEIALSGCRRVCAILAFASMDMARWLPFLDRIEAYGRDEGCDAIWLQGRKGWERVLSDYELSHIVMEKKLS